MPTLKRETAILPTNLLADDWQPVEEGGMWWVIHTSPRSEKALARQLCRHGIPFYLPLYEKTAKRQRRLVRSYLPLFPGYMFIVASEQQRSTAIHTNLVVNCLEVRDQQRLRSDLCRIHGLCETGELITPERKLQVGTVAEITSGPLKGYRGTIVRTGSAMRFVIEVDFLQSGASVEVDVTCVRPL
jgi:transcription antitermination factor NusG